MFSRRFRDSLKLFLALGSTLVASHGQTATAPDPAALAQARADLGSPHFALREAATRLLWQHAAIADEQLEAARKALDPEVRQRAERIWEAVRLGILPDTPRAVVEQIYAFHDGTIQEKRTILTQLVAADNLNTAFRLLRSLEDARVREDLVVIVATHVRAKLLPHLLKRDWSRAAEILEDAALSDLGMRDYAAFAFLTGRLEAGRVDEELATKNVQFQTWLMRAADRMEDAAGLAKGDPDLEREIRAGTGDALAFCEKELAQPNLSTLQSARARAYKARLTNDLPGFTQATGELLTLAKDEKPSYNQRFAVEALLLNDVVEQVLPLLPKRSRQTAYDVQSYRGMYREALQQLGIQDERPPYAAWSEAKCKALGEDKEGSAALQEILNLVRHLLDMGERDEMNRILDEAFEATKDNPDLRQILVTEEIRVGAREIAEKHLRILNKTGTRVDQLQGLLPFQQPDLVAQWYEFFIKADSSPANRLEALIKAWELIDVREGDRRPVPQLGTHLDAAYDSATNLNADDRANYLQNLYLTAAGHKDEERTIHYLRDLASLTGDSLWFFRLGSTYLESQSWKEAAEAFDRAWQIHSATVKAGAMDASDRSGSNRLEPSYLYLAGMAHTKAGDPDHGKELVDQSRLLCLGDLGARYRLANTMNRHGDEALARDEWALITRLSRMDEAEGTWSFYHLADALQKTDAAKAIACQERFIVARHTLDPFAQQLPVTFTIRLRSQIHQWQTKAHLENGDTTKALASLEDYWQLTPGNASIGEELLPLLEEAGQQDKARAYYDKTRQLAEEACQVFPNSAMAHNNLAWLDARSRRYLDQAQEHAESAVRLKPGTAAYLDTLAEVYFAKGDRAKALELSDQAVKLTPDDKELLGQRARFENAPLPAKRPAGE